MILFSGRGGKPGKSGIVLTCFLLMFARLAYGAEPSRKEPADWRKVHEEARKEGKLVLVGDPSEEWRKTLAGMFQEEHPEIKVEYTGMVGRAFGPRIKQERAMGQKLWDLFLLGTTTGYEAKKAGFLDPIRPILFPEIADAGKWIGGLDGLFTDKENKFVVSYTLSVERTSSVNRDFIRASEIKSSKQLIDPRFKGKIVIQLPTSGATLVALGNLAFMYGQNFVRDFLARQNPIVTEDKRQQAEWMVRGTYPLAVGFNNTQLMPFRKQGLGKNIVKLEDTIIPAGTGAGCLCLLKDAPHPNAARLYINWLLSRPTQLKLSRNVLLNSRRIDVPPVVKELSVDPANLSRYYLYSTEENAEKVDLLRPLIKESLKR